MAIALILLGLYAVQASAQVTSYVDENGKRVYVNVNKPEPPKPAPKAVPPPTDKSAKDSLKAAETTPAPPKASPTSSGVAQGQFQASHRQNLDVMVSETAERHRLDPNLVRAVIQAESAWNPLAVSRKGAFGLMQLVPGTAARFGVRNVFDPQQNLEGGVSYLQTLLARYSNDLPRALAAYNAGEGAVDRFGGVPNFRETRLYVQKITHSYFQPGSGAFGLAAPAAHPVRRTVDEHGRVVFTNE